MRHELTFGRQYAKKSPIGTLTVSVGLILINLLILNIFNKKTRMRTTCTQPAPALCSHRFSKYNAQGYPQE
ncbi:hypothetical protein BSQ40_01660 [Serratia fonticola]|nr:hypothetical protein BSQ40_01660 [Serratia fonticola]